MERAYKLMYDSKDKMYSFPDFSYKFRSNHVEQVAPKVLYRLIAKCKWLHEPIPEPTQVDGGTVIIIEEDIVCEDYLLHEEGFLGALRRISCAGDAALLRRIATVSRSSMPVRLWSTARYVRSMKTPCILILKACSARSRIWKRTAVAWPPSTA